MDTDDDMNMPLFSYISSLLLFASLLFFSQGQRMCRMSRIMSAIVSAVHFAVGADMRMRLGQHPFRGMEQAGQGAQGPGSKRDGR